MCVCQSIRFLVSRILRYARQDSANRWCTKDGVIRDKPSIGENEQPPPAATTRARGAAVYQAVNMLGCLSAPREERSKGLSVAIPVGEDEVKHQIIIERCKKQPACPVGGQLTVTLALTVAPSSDHAWRVVAASAAMRSGAI